MGRLYLERETGATVYDPEDDGFDCTACGGRLYWLGQLGRRGHYRCRDCGIDCSREEA